MQVTEISETIIKQLSEPKDIWVISSRIPGRLCTGTDSGRDWILGFIEEDHARLYINNARWDSPVTEDNKPFEITIEGALRVAKNMPIHPNFPKMRCGGVVIIDPDAGAKFLKV